MGKREARTAEERTMRKMLGVILAALFALEELGIQITPLQPQSPEACASFRRPKPGAGGRSSRRPASRRSEGALTVIASASEAIHRAEETVWIASSLRSSR
jgi:hypothetical protein